MRYWGAFFVGLTIAAVVISIFRPQEVQSQSVFRALEGEHLVSTLFEQDDVVNAHVLAVDKEQLRSQMESGEPVVLPLFDGQEVTLSKKRSALLPGNDRFVWSGIAEGQRGYAVFAFRNDVVVGTIWRDDAVYDLRFIENETYSFVERDSSRMPQLQDDTVQKSDADFSERDLDIQEYNTLSNSTQTEDGSIIDIMVVYTEDARQAAGGEDAMLAEIDLAMMDANEINNNSDVQFDFWLVHAQETSYDEAAAWDPNRSDQQNAGDMLSEFEDPSDGIMDDIHTSRDDSMADISVLLFQDQQSSSIGGVANTMTANFYSTTFESYAFATVDREQAVAIHTFAHEIGHVMGNQHDSSNSSTRLPVFSYSYGYLDPAGDFRTVMAYENACARSGGCDLIPYWSSATIRYDGSAIGSASEDNAQSLNNTASTVANFRNAYCEPPSSGDWTITTTCRAYGTDTVPGSVTVQSGATLYLAPSADMDIDMQNDSMTVEHGGGVLIHSGGKLN